MPWLKKAGEMPRNEKIWELSDPMYRLYDGSLHYCAENLTDGHVPASRITALTPKPATKPQIEALVTRRLWHRLPHLTCKSCIKLRAEHHAGELPKSGYLVHDFLEFNPSKTEWQNRSEKRAEAGRFGGIAKAANAASTEPGTTPSSALSKVPSKLLGAEPGTTPSSALSGTPSPYPVPRTPSSGSIDPVPAEDPFAPDAPEDADLSIRRGRREGVGHVRGAAEAVVAAARRRSGS